MLYQVVQHNRLACYYLGIFGCTWHGDVIPAVQLVTVRGIDRTPIKPPRWPHNHCRRQTDFYFARRPR